MTNLALSNKKTQYTAKADGTNVRIEGQVSVDDTLKVTDYNGSVYVVGSSQHLGSFNYSSNNASCNLMTQKELLSEASQLIIDTVAGIETKVATV